MTAPERLVDRAVAPLGNDTGGLGLAGLFETTMVSAIVADTPRAEALARLVALRHRLVMARKAAVAILADAGWRDAEDVVRATLGGAATSDAASRPRARAA